MDYPETVHFKKAFKESMCILTCPNCNYKFPSDGAFHWQWVIQAILNEDPNSNITPMDFDGVVERNGHFLVLETKDEGVPIAKGQLITLEALRNPKSFYVMKVWNKKNPTNIEVETVIRGKLYQKKSYGIENAMRYVRNWYNWANTH